MHTQTLKTPSTLKRGSEDFIAYHKIESKGNKKPGIIFFSGFKSDMQGTKALFLENLCEKEGCSFIRFDYFGHGESSGNFTEGTIGKWADDALAVIDELTEGKQILVGSSLGGWIMLLAALKRPERVKALLGVASAPDFTEDLIWNALKPEEQEIIMKEGIYNLPNEYCDSPDEEEPYPITRKLMEEARNHLLLRDNIDITCPIRLLHGMQDEDVPPETSLKIMEKVKSDDVIVKFIKNGDHRMSSPQALELLGKTARELIIY